MLESTVTHFRRSPCVDSTHPARSRGSVEAEVGLGMLDVSDGAETCHTLSTYVLEDGNVLGLIKDGPWCSQRHAVSSP